MSVETAVQALGLAIGFLAGMVGHEYAHAQVSDRLGDKTPRLHGRLTLNPKAHVDPLGTIVLPSIFILSVLVGRPLALMFGWAKPVPTNPHRLREPRNGRVWVALAGPATNLIIAGAAGLGCQAVSGGACLPSGGDRIAQVLFWIVVVNAFLFVVNSLPIPPLDGSKILARFLPPQAADRFESFGQYGLLFLLLFFLFPPLGDILTGLVDPVIRLATGL